MEGWRDGGTEGRMLTGVHTGTKEGALPSRSSPLPPPGHSVLPYPVLDTPVSPEDPEDTKPTGSSSKT